jgi:hypothetical protein
MCRSFTVCTIHRPVICVRRNGTEVSSCCITYVCRPVLHCGSGEHIDEASFTFTVVLSGLRSVPPSQFVYEDGLGANERLSART